VVTAHDTGLFHELAASPVDRDEVTRAASRRRRLRREAEWAPPDLITTVRPHDGGIRPVPLEPAETIPPALR
jgi:hypothetical protein